MILSAIVLAKAPPTTTSAFGRSQWPLPRSTLSLSFTRYCFVASNSAGGAGRSAESDMRLACARRSAALPRRARLMAIGRVSRQSVQRWELTPEVRRQLICCYAYLVSDNHSAQKTRSATWNVSATELVVPSIWIENVEIAL